MSIHLIAEIKDGFVREEQMLKKGIVIVNHLQHVFDKSGRAVKFLRTVHEGYAGDMDASCGLSKFDGSLFSTDRVVQMRVELISLVNAEKCWCAAVTLGLKLAVFSVHWKPKLTLFRCSSVHRMPIKLIQVANKFL